MTTELTAKPLDLIFQAYRRRPFRDRRAGPLKKLAQWLDRIFYRDEAEYLETPGIPMAKRVAVVESLSRLNNRSGYTAIFLKELYSLIQTTSRQRLSPTFKILDIGAGGGGLLKAIHGWARKKKIPVDLWGLDLSEDFIRATRARFEREGVPARLIQGDACRLDLEDESFDLVLCNYMVHHLRSADLVASFFSEAYRVARTGWLVVDLDRRLWGPAFMALGATFFGAPPVVLSDGMKSIRRAYKADEINFILKKLERAGKVRDMHCLPYPGVPYWRVKGRKSY